MPRTFLVKDKTSFDTLAKSMVDARVRPDLAAAALDQLREANPHAGRELEPGTVILVPDTPGLKPSAGEPASQAIGEILKALVGNAIEETAQRSRERLAERSARRAEIAAAVNGPGFKRAAAAAQISATPFQEAAKALAEEDKKDQEAAERLTAIGAAALAALARLDKFVR